MGFFRKLFRRKKKKKITSIRQDSPTQLENNGYRQPDVGIGTQRPVLSPRNISGPVDLDELEEQEIKQQSNQSFEEITKTAASNAVDLVSPTGSENHASASASPKFTMPEDTRFSAGHMPADEGSDGESSSFNLSTDAEDTEYNRIRERLGIVKQPELLTNYTTDGETSVFPNLPSEDEGTLTSSVAKEASETSILNLNGIHASTGASLTPEPFSPQPESKQPIKALSLSKKDSPERRIRLNRSSFDQAEAKPAPPPRRTFTKPTFDTNSFEPFSPDSTGFPNTNGGFDFADFSNFPNEFKPTMQRSPRRSNSSRSVTRDESSLHDLLSKRTTSRKKTSHSVSSAPAITAAYIRKHHNLKPRTTKQRVKSVTDVIQDLEAANIRRSDNHSSHSRDSHKERLRRRRERRHQQQQYSSDDSDLEENESWLFDEVQGALGGPRNPDMESLSGRSNSSRGIRRRRRRRKSGSDTDSRHSRESRSSRRSRSSRYSHRSTRSYISQMSEQSRSVANDLKRLEMQLAMVGSNEKNLRKTTTRSRITVTAPPGKLGIILANKSDKGTVVSGVRTSSALANQISPGDRIVAIDGEDVSLMTVSEITTIMARKAEFERTLTVLTMREKSSSYRK